MGQGTLARQCRETRDPFLIGDLGHDHAQLGVRPDAGPAVPGTAAALTVLMRRSPVSSAGPVARVRAGPRAGATEIRNRTAYAHGANTAWQYAVMTTDGNGYVSAASGADPGGLRLGPAHLITPRLPNPPAEVRAEAIAGGLLQGSVGAMTRTARGTGRMTFRWAMSR